MRQTGIRKFTIKLYKCIGVALARSIRIHKYTIVNTLQVYRYPGKQSPRTIL